MKTTSCNAAGRDRFPVVRFEPTERICCDGRCLQGRDCPARPESVEASRGARRRNPAHYFAPGTIDQGKVSPLRRMARGFGRLVARVLTSTCL